MKFRNLLLIACFALLTTSCMSLALSVLGINKKESPMSVYTNGTKSIAYIPMKHIGPKEFYANVARRVDSLQKQGYTVYMESVRVTDSLTPQQRDTLKLKVRRLMGVTLGKGGYLDTINGRLMGRKFSNKKELINQPVYSKLGVDTLSGRIVDVPLNVLIKQYEKQYGTIQLDVCDYTTPLEDKYDCGREKRSQANDLILRHRNKNLADAIIADKHNKIAILYGAAHESGLLELLKQVDATWHLDKKEDH
ncbi:hypothetical protein AM493_06120 [Flavobacterium akiainvivens]|uniref:Uncharacterized protein n=1 Tax=Flavobacterium akiainvivens TaxID=1202724 RepID=A0A0N0RQJ0_9FLAO|nr:hypothetical protein [Flavobacterium akiainvivens]KOS05656.1 hypothetical protein AM493_06120 [Flavobacterium akiainvivens]SFQ36124.1 hypothetical protein SAMN05444144_103260 [Flavobacterium akiainvivens]